MSFVRVCRLPVVLLLIVSLASSGRWASATERVVGNPTDPNRVVRDVRLTPEGALRVRAVDTNGQPIPSGTVQLRRNGISVAVETTDDDGTLSIWGLKGGVYEIEMEGNLQMCRVWSATTAPPAAINSAYLVIDTPIVRGQRPLDSLVNRRTLFLGALVVAAIAIPLATQDDDESGS